MNCILLVVALMTLCVPAKSKEIIDLPPVEFDRPYIGKTVVKHYVDWKVLQKECDALAPVWGCAWLDEEICHLALMDKKMMSARNYGRLYRHEIAHCNGWGGDHKGAR